MNNAAAFTGIAIFELPLSNGKIYVYSGGREFENRIDRDINSLQNERVKAIFVPCQFSKFICLN